MLGLFTIMMGIVIGKIVYEICLYLLNRFRGVKALNPTVSIIVAVALVFGLVQWFIEYLH